MQSYRITADEAKKRLIEGNRNYIMRNELANDVSPDTLLRFCRNFDHVHFITSIYG